MSQSPPSNDGSSSVGDPIVAAIRDGDGEQIRKDLLQVEEWCRYHAPTPHQQYLLQLAQGKFLELMEFLVINLEPSRERSLALTELRTARMMVNQAIVFDEGTTA